MFKNDNEKLTDLIWDELDCPKDKQAMSLILGLEKRVAANDFSLDLIKELISILENETKKSPDEWTDIKEAILAALNGN